MLRFVDNTFSESSSISLGNTEYKNKDVTYDGNSHTLRYFSHFSLFFFKTNSFFFLSIYDTAGQERFRIITSSFFHGSHGVILAFDLTKMESFKSLESNSFKMFLIKLYLSITST